MARAAPKRAWRRAVQLGRGSEMPEWWEAYLPTRPEGVPTDIPGYASPVLQPPSLPIAVEPFPIPEPPMQAQSMLPELSPDSALAQLPDLPPPPPPGGVQPLPETAPLAALPDRAPPEAPRTPDEIEADRLQAARESIGYQPVEISPDAPLGERLAVERAGIGAEAAAQALAARQKAADERQRLMDMEATRAADEQRRMADAETRAAEQRSAYHETLKKSGSWTGKQTAGLVAAALMDALAVALQPTGQQRSNFPNILDTFLKANQGAWDNQVKAALDAASEGQDDVDRLVSREREAQRQYHLQRAAVSEALAEELDLVSAQAIGQDQAIMAKNAAEMARAQQKAAEAKAAREGYKLETDRLGKAGDILYKKGQLKLRGEELKQREIESKRGAAIDWARVKLARKAEARQERKDDMDAELASRKYNKEEQEQLQAQGVLGFDGKPFVAGTSERADKLQGLKTDAELAIALIDKIQGFRTGGKGGVLRWDEQSQRALANYGELLLRMKEVYGLGQIQGADMTLIENVIATEPGKVTEEMLKDIYSRLDETRANVVDAVNTRFTNAQYKGPQWSPEKPSDAPPTVMLEEDWLRQAQSRVSPASGRPVPVSARIEAIKGLREDYRPRGGDARKANEDFKAKIFDLSEQEEDVLEAMEKPAPSADRLAFINAIDLSERTPAMKLELEVGGATPEQIEAQRQFLRELTKYRRSLPRD